MRTITFGEKDSWEDYHLLTLTVDMQSPSVRVVTQEVAGRDGVIDYTEALTGYPVFNNRAGAFSFRIVGDNCKQYRDIFVKEVHGKKQPIRISDEAHAYYGRCEVTTSKDKGYYCEVSVKVDAEPFKIADEDTRREVAVSGETTVTVINNGDAAVSPEFTTDAELQIAYENWVYNISEGTSKMPFVFEPKQETELTLTGTANVVISWRERYL